MSSNSKRVITDVPPSDPPNASFPAAVASNSADDPNSLDKSNRGGSSLPIDQPLCDTLHRMASMTGSPVRRRIWYAIHCIEFGSSALLMFMGGIWSAPRSVRHRAALSLRLLGHTLPIRRCRPEVSHLSSRIGNARNAPPPPRLLKALNRANARASSRVVDFRGTHHMQHNVVWHARSGRSGRGRAKSVGYRRTVPAGVWSVPMCVSQCSPRSHSILRAQLNNEAKRRQKSWCPSSTKLRNPMKVFGFGGQFQDVTLSQPGHLA